MDRDSHNLFLVAMSEHAHYADFLKMVEDARPQIPVFNPKDDNTENWKKQSGMRQGYDLFASLLKLKFED